MRCRSFGLVVIALIGCNGSSGTPDDDGVSPDGAAPDSGEPVPPPPPDDGCATAPTGDWTGTSRVTHGAAATETREATLTWTLASTEGCVDTYAPAGTLDWILDGLPCDHWSPSSVPIGAADGALVIDRNTAPATYRVQGATTWEATYQCPDGNEGYVATVGGVWADHRGTVDGLVLAGGVDEDQRVLSWRFTRDGASTQTPDCTGTPAARWVGVHRIVTESSDATATVAWDLATTSGCVDTFTPAGTITLLGLPTAACVSASFSPASATIDPDDGTLVVDRSTDPPRYRVEGSSLWDGSMSCTAPDGATYTTPQPITALWATSFGELVGDRASAGTSDFSDQFDWSLRR